MGISNPVTPTERPSFEIGSFGEGNLSSTAVPHAGQNLKVLSLSFPHCEQKAIAPPGVKIAHYQGKYPIEAQELQEIFVL
jgi:hypothetical protein